MRTTGLSQGARACLPSGAAVAGTQASSELLGFRVPVWGWGVQGNPQGPFAVGSLWVAPGSPRRVGPSPHQGGPPPRSSFPSPGASRGGGAASTPAAAGRAWALVPTQLPGTPSPKTQGSQNMEVHGDSGELGSDPPF